MNRTRIAAPCKDCTNRTPGCHDRCYDYKAWKAEQEKIRQAEKEYLSKPFSKIL